MLIWVKSSTSCDAPQQETKTIDEHLEEQFSSFDPLAYQIAMYILKVCMRVFEQSGGDMRKVNTQDIRDAEAKIKPLLSPSSSAGDGFSERAKAVERSQPHLMDEVLWALFDRAEEEQKGRRDASQSKAVSTNLLDALGCCRSLKRKMATVTLF